MRYKKRLNITNG